MFDGFSMNCQCLDSRLCQLYRFFLLPERREAGVVLADNAISKNISLGNQDNIPRTNAWTDTTGSVKSHSQIHPSVNIMNLLICIKTTFVFLTEILLQQEGVLRSWIMDPIDDGI